MWNSEFGTGQDGTTTMTDGWTTLEEQTWRLKYLIRWIKIKNLMYKKTMNQDSMCDKELKKIENFWLNVQTLFEEIYSGSMTFWTDMGRKTVILLSNLPFYVIFWDVFFINFLYDYKICLFFPIPNIQSCYIEIEQGFTFSAVISSPLSLCFLKRYVTPF